MFVSCPSLTITSIANIIPLCILKINVNLFNALSGTIVFKYNIFGYKYRAKVNCEILDLVSN